MPIAYNVYSYLGRLMNDLEFADYESAAEFCNQCENDFCEDEFCNQCDNDFCEDEFTYFFIQAVYPDSDKP